MQKNSVALLSAALSGVALVWACDREAEPPTATSDPAEAQVSAVVRQQLRARLERLSTMPMLQLASRLGVTTIQDKPLKRRKAARGNGPTRKLSDVPIANHSTAHENEPTITASPKQKKRLVAGYHYITEAGGVRCQARRSTDGGRSWSSPVLMPQLTAASQCSDPVLAYSPDGGRVFYAYMDIKFFPINDTLLITEFDILVSYSTDGGATWTGPFIALDAVRGVFDYDKPWIGTPDDASNYVYVTATRFDATGDFACHIAFTRSTNGGTSYGAPQTLDESSGACGGEPPTPVVQGSRPTGGKKGDVLVAWYHSGFDGWLTGSFQIRTRYSADFGASFGPVVEAVTDASEAPFWKGPFLCYERWWPSMFPDVELGPSGAAHLAYAHDPVAGFETPEDGDIRYATSRGAPYTSWSAPVTVNDDRTASAQGFVALEVKAEGSGQSAKPHAVWVDHRLPLEVVTESQCLFGIDVENLEYDIFYSTRQGQRWSPNVRVTDRSSLSDFVFAGDYIDLTAATGSPFAIWTDRRDKRSIFDFEDDVWGGGTHRVHQFAVGR
jgi:hypothetical protein